MSHQNPLTVIVPVNKERLQELRSTLDTIKEDLLNGNRFAFQSIGTIHFCRWIILEENTTYGNHYPLKLAFSSNFDGDTDKHLNDLCSGDVSKMIDNIYSCCEGYPSESERSTSSRVEYLRKGSIEPMAFYCSAPGRTVDQIKKESLLRNHLRTQLNTADWKSSSATTVHQSLKKNVLNDPQFDWVKNQIQLPGKNWLGLIFLGVILLILLPLIIVWILIIHFFYERKDKPLGLTPSQVDEKQMRELEEYEDYQFQNQFTQVLEMKPGVVRLITLKAFMLLARGLIKFLFVENNLMGIPTIHFARWIIMDNNKRMLFLSNFDGSWQQYLGDFIDKSGWGLTAIWSNTMGFPKTNFLVTGGAYDAEHFLAWSRYYEIKTQVWYTAYPNLSIKNIVNNSHIRADLIKDLNEEEAQKFLNRF